MKTLIFNQTIKWRDLEFEKILEFMKPRIKFHCYTKSHMIEGLDSDDIFQELSIVLWKTLPKVPEGIEYLDFRFTKYFDKVFTLRLFEIRRNKMNRSLYLQKVYQSKDLLDICEQLTEPKESEARHLKD